MPLSWCTIIRWQHIVFSITGKCLYNFWESLAYITILFDSLSIEALLVHHSPEFTEIATEAAVSRYTNMAAVFCFRSYSENDDVSCNGFISSCRSYYSGKTHIQSSLMGNTNLTYLKNGHECLNLNPRDLEVFIEHIPSAMATTIRPRRLWHLNLGSTKADVCQ